MNLTTNDSDHNTVNTKNTKTWDELKKVITSSTGFERWQRSRELESQTTEELVVNYLRETLETLAY